MNRLILLTFLTSIVLGVKAQSWGHNDHRQENQGNQGWDNPYQDPNYYPNAHGNRGCPPPPHPSGRRNVVIVTPPPTYCTPVVIAPRPLPYFRPYGYNGYRRAYSYGHRPRGWRGR